MDKINHTTKDILGGNIEKIAQLFPSVITEAQDEATGEVKKAIDFDLLRQHLSDELVEGDRERFRLDWPGKKASILKANTPTTKTLRPVREDSEDFDTTQNVFIEGDNFEVLKVLQESYLGKIKMIYIDPPYNTGKDFIYRDNFTQDRDDYEEEIGIRDDENGGKLVKNTETNGRYHSDWLSMMQERLIVARDLLTDNGVLFISIDDNEQADLKKLSDEVFGEDNFLTQIVWDMNNSAQSGIFKVYHQYVLAYTKTIEMMRVPKSTDNELFSAIAVKKIDRRHPVREFTFPKGTRFDAPDGKEITGEWGGSVRLKIVKGRLISENGKLKEDVTIAAGFTQMNQMKDYFDGKEEIIDSRGQKVSSFYLNSSGMVQVVKERGVKTLPTIQRWGNQSTASNVAASLFDSAQSLFDSPKPVGMIKEIVSWFSETEDLVLDFFSGSGTTAHAVMQLNAEDGGNRKHIQVQLAEPTDPTSEAYKAGYKTIPEISRERIRRAAKKIREDYAEQIAKRDTPLDTGFRAYRLSSSNFVDTAQHPNETTQVSLLETSNNIKEDRNAEDLLTETILDLGLTLDLPIEQRDIAGHNVYFVGGNSLVACFDDKVSLDIVDGIAAEKPLRVVFKDSSFKDDQTRINIDIRLKQLSPDTTVQVV